MKYLLTIVLLVTIIPSFAGEKGNGITPESYIGHDAGRRISKLCPIFFEKPKPEDMITLTIKGENKTYRLSDVRAYCCYEAKLSVCDEE